MCPHKRKNLLILITLNHGERKGGVLGIISYLLYQPIKWEPRRPLPTSIHHQYQLNSKHCNPESCCVIYNLSAESQHCNINWPFLPLTISNIYISPLLLRMWYISVLCHTRSGLFWKTVVPELPLAFKGILTPTFMIQMHINHNPTDPS